MPILRKKTYISLRPPAVRTLFSPNRWKYKYFSLTSPLLVLSTPEKHYQVQVFRIYKTVWFEHENTFQNYEKPGEKGDAYRPERILDGTLSTIHGFSTLAANNKTQTIVRSRNNKNQSNSPMGRVRRVLSRAGETWYQGFTRLESFTSWPDEKLPGLTYE